jgi:TrmH family RNA methyltransferase
MSAPPRLAHHHWVERVTISSTANARIRAAARLRDRRERDRTGLSLVDGAREVRRALDVGVEVVEAFVSPSLAERPDGRAIIDQFDGLGTQWVWATDEALARLAFGDRSEGVVVVIRPPAIGLDRLDPPPRPLVVVAEGLEKPGNLGAMLRSADGAGADAFIVADPRTDPFNPNAIRASLGTIFKVPLAAASSADVLAWLFERDIRPLAASAEAAESYTDADLTGGVALVLGSEAEGLGEAWRDPRVGALRIPMHGMADSLNVSVAAAVLLYEARRQRDVPASPDRRRRAARKDQETAAG